MTAADWMMIAAFFMFAAGIVFIWRGIGAEKDANLRENLAALALTVHQNDGEWFARCVSEGFDVARDGADIQGRNPYCPPVTTHEKHDPFKAAGWQLGAVLGSAHYDHARALQDSFVEAARAGFNGENRSYGFPVTQRFYDLGKEFRAFNS